MAEGKDLSDAEREYVKNLEGKGQCQDRADEVCAGRYHREYQDKQ